MTWWLGHAGPGRALAILGALILPPLRLGLGEAGQPVIGAAVAFALPKAPRQLSHGSSRHSSWERAGQGHGCRQLSAQNKEGPQPRQGGHSGVGGGLCGSTQTSPARPRGKASTRLYLSALGAMGSGSAGCCSPSLTVLSRTTGAAQEQNQLHPRNCPGHTSCSLLYSTSRKSSVSFLTAQCRREPRNAEGQNHKRTQEVTDSSPLPEHVWCNQAPSGEPGFWGPRQAPPYTPRPSAITSRARPQLATSVAHDANLGAHRPWLLTCLWPEPWKENTGVALRPHLHCRHRPPLSSDSLPPYTYCKLLKQGKPKRPALSSLYRPVSFYILPLHTRAHRPSCAQQGLPVPNCSLPVGCGAWGSPPAPHPPPPHTEANPSTPQLPNCT